VERRRKTRRFANVLIMRKNIDLSDEAVKALSIQAIENGTNFKNYVEAKLEELAKTKLPPRAREGGKKK
jgi:hypothetical protein